VAVEELVTEPAVERLVASSRQSACTLVDAYEVDQRRVFCSTATLTRLFCCAGVIGGAATVVLVVVEPLVALISVVNTTNSTRLPRCQ
jgi:hypothetical protein